MTDTDTLTLPVLPLTTGVVLPQMVVTIALESDEAKAATTAAGENGRLLLVPRIDGANPRVGVVARIESSDTVTFWPTLAPTWKVAQALVPSIAP